MMHRLVAAASLAALVLLAATRAHAFCGFYVGGAGAKLFNNATMVVLMRDGTRTVLSMQNNYQGPPENFAMVVPVPVVLEKENVKTLPREVFDRIDLLDAPRLVEYWEQDPCYRPPVREEKEYDKMAMPAETGGAAPRGQGVKVEAQFAVGEYEIVILSASSSAGLDEWLHDAGYKIPEGAEPLLRPYVQQGMKFFVAKVDVSKVKLEGAMAMLSPLRFHYDAEQFALPVRLGLANSNGTQDLIVHILGRKRYEVANYKNVFIPTNLAVSEEARDKFAPFYAALFDATVAKNPGAVITEYAWAASTCDPCPGPPLDDADFMTLGGDVLPGADAEAQRYGASNGFVLTRLHARYGKDTLGDDLIFKEAGAVIGGRGTPDEQGRLDPSVKTDEGYDNFQGRYAILHPWKDAVHCLNPRRGVWGGPPGHDEWETRPARDLAFAPRGGVSLPAILRVDVPELGIKAKVKRSGCGCSVASRGGAGAGAFAILAALAAVVVRRRRRR